MSEIFDKEICKISEIKSFFKNEEEKNSYTMDLHMENLQTLRDNKELSKEFRWQKMCEEFGNA